jgi:hypothetical protein
MKVNKSGFIDLMHFPIEETTAIIGAMKKAEQEGDLPALKWCARRVIRLFGLFEDDPCGCDELYIPVKVFNEIWETELKHDPTPESIAAVINPPSPPESKNKTVSREASYRKCSLNLNFTDVDLQINNRSEALTLLEDLIYADGVINDRIALEALKDAIEREVILL